MPTDCDAAAPSPARRRTVTVPVSPAGMSLSANEDDVPDTDSPSDGVTAATGVVSAVVPRLWNESVTLASCPAGMGCISLREMSTAGAGTAAGSDEEGAGADGSSARTAAGTAAMSASARTAAAARRVNIAWFMEASSSVWVRRSRSRRR